MIRVFPPFLIAIAALSMWSHGMIPLQLAQAIAAASLLAAMAVLGRVVSHG